MTAAARIGSASVAAQGHGGAVAGADLEHPAGDGGEKGAEEMGRMRTDGRGHGRFMGRLRAGTGTAGRAGVAAGGARFR